VREADLEALLVPHGGSASASAQSIISSQAAYGLNSEGNTVASPDLALIEAARPSGPPSARRPSYSPSALRAWFGLRVVNWPKDAPFPTEAKDLAAAGNEFEGQIPRDEFRRIRREKTPGNWRKPGPRRARQ